MILHSLILAAFLQVSTPQIGSTPPSDPRIQTLPYDAGRVFPLRVAQRHQLTLILASNEHIENVAIGDADAWQVTVNNRGDAVFLKPLRVTGVTNMTIITDARVYNFELSPSQGQSMDSPFTVRFSYPDTANMTSVGAAPRSGLGRYRLSGARGIRPVAIDDDGLTTFIQWKPDQPLPAVFAVDENNAETLIQGQVRDGRYVIDSVNRVLVFRAGGEVARAVRRTPRTSAR